MCEQAKPSSRLAWVDIMAARSDCRTFFLGGGCNRAPLPPSPPLRCLRLGQLSGRWGDWKKNEGVSPFRTLCRGPNATDDLNLKSARKSAAKPVSHWE